MDKSHLNLFLCLLLVSTTAATNAPIHRSISWWYDVGESNTTDAANIAAISAHRNVFSRVMPYNAQISLDGNATNWWNQDEKIAAWNAPLQKMNIPVLPYVLDIDNATQMHLVYANSTKFIQDAVAIAEHYNFQGWFIDYEDEYPPDTSQNKSQALAAFLTEFGDALHEKKMKLCICVASWSAMLSDYQVLAASSVDELQLMSTYSNPSNSKSLIQSYYEEVQKGDSSSDALKKAGVGIGIYYDGRNGYEKSWNETSARNFIQNNIVSQGGNAIDVYRLLKDEKDDWPHENYWWDLFEQFITGKMEKKPVAIPAPNSKCDSSCLTCSNRYPVTAQICDETNVKQQGFSHTMHPNSNNLHNIKHGDGCVGYNSITQNMEVISPCSIATSPTTWVNSTLYDCQQLNITDGTIGAGPNCYDNEDNLNGCLDIKGKVGPGLQLTKCYHQPNDNFTITNGVWSSENLLPMYPQRCMQVDEQVCTRAGCCTSCPPGREMSSTGFCILTTPPAPQRKVIVFLAITSNATAVDMAIAELFKHRSSFTGVAFQYLSICGAGNNDLNRCSIKDAVGPAHLAPGNMGGNDPADVALAGDLPLRLRKVLGNGKYSSERERASRIWKHCS